MAGMVQESGCRFLKNEVHTEEYYVASIDLLGIKNIIKLDTEDENLNRIKNIYNSWPRILKDGYFQDMKIRFFSDNFVIALQANTHSALDKLLEAIAWICSHFLRCGYKPRGGITKGQFFMDDIFVWGPALVDAYLLESKEAIYPRILIDEKIESDASVHLSSWMIYRDEDGKLCLNYLKAYGGNRELWLKDIDAMLPRVEQEINELEEKPEFEDKEKIKRKLIWLKKFEESNRKFWEDYN